MAKAVTFGEIMLRFSPEGYNRLFQDDKFRAFFGGAEANTAVALANYGIESKYVTRLPERAVGQAAVNSLRQLGVDTSAVVRGGERVGIYYLEKGASQRPSVCIYDRKHSAVSESCPEDYAWDEIFDGADWFHFTGITPALSESLQEICLTAVKAAKKKGLKISLDTNYRSKLWTIEQASAVITELCEYVDVLITNPGDAKDLFGIISEKSDFNLKAPDNEGAASVAKQLMKRFPLEAVALTLRNNISASDNSFGGLLCDKDGCNFSKNYNMHIVDRVGGGDAFAAGLIYARLAGKSPKAAIEFATASGVLKHSVEGDYSRATVSEVELLADGDASGRVQR